MLAHTIIEKTKKNYPKSFIQWILISETVGENDRYQKQL